METKLIRINADIHKKLKANVAVNETSMTKVVEELIESYLLKQQMKKERK